MRRFKLMPLVFAATVMMMAAAVAWWPRLAWAIVNGELDGIGHPNVGELVIPGGLVDLDGDGVPDPTYLGASGVLIHPRVFLRAGHGTYPIQQDLAAGRYTIDAIHVGFGAQVLADRLFEASGVLTHPGYVPQMSNADGAVPSADVGVLILKDPVEGIEPATLPPSGFLDGLQATGQLRAGRQGTRFNVVGYGWYGTAPNQIYRRDGQRRVAQSGFRLLQDRWLFLDQNAAHGFGGGAPLDSGGPVFWVNPDTGEEVLVALTCRGDAASVATGITYRLDTPEALVFLNRVIQMVNDGEL